MKNVGITRPVDNLGRIVIPIEIRNRLNISAKDPVDIYVEDNRIILTKSSHGCMFCSGEKSLTEYKGKMICKKCLNDLIKSTAK